MPWGLITVLELYHYRPEPQCKRCSHKFEVGEKAYRNVSSGGAHGRAKGCTGKAKRYKVKYYCLDCAKVVGI